jgi:hypothetical protein
VQRVQARELRVDPAADPAGGARQRDVLGVRDEERRDEALEQRTADDQVAQRAHAQCDHGTL